MRLRFPSLASLAVDLSAFLGVAAIAYGAWLVYAPAGYITGGAALLTGALLAAKGDTK